MADELDPTGEVSHLGVGWVVAAALGDLLLFGFGTWAEALFGLDAYLGLATAAGGIAIVTMAGIKLATRQIRDGLATAFALTYLVLFVYVVYLPGVEVDESSRDLVGNVGWLVGVVLLGYFGSRTAEAFARFHRPVITDPGTVPAGATDPMPPGQR